MTRKTERPVHSEPLQALDQGGAVHLTVGKGVKSTAAGNAVEEAKSNWVKVPTLYSPALSDASAQVVDTDGGQGQRALVVGFSDAVKDKELARATKAGCCRSTIRAMPRPPTMPKTSINGRSTASVKRCWRRRRHYH